MSEPDWQPANRVEHDLAAALEREDGQAYAQLLRTCPLFLPVPPPEGSDKESQLAEVFPPDADYVPVFTSLESLVWAFGDLIQEYEELDFPTLLQRWPDRSQQVAVNLGSPIATFFPPHALTDLAEGRQSLVPAEEVQQAVADEVLRHVRWLCLRDLAGGATGEVPEAAPGADEEEVPLRDDPPANALEQALREAVEQSESEAFLEALLSNPVILPTGDATTPERIFDDSFPWRVVGGGQAKVIPVFSSLEMLARTGAAGAPYLEIDFLHVLANWPSDEHLLLVNPGSVLELALPGELVMEVVASMAEALENDGR